MANVSERIQQLISEQCGGSQQVFAEKTGLTKGSVSQYVNGRNEPSKKTAAKIAEAFDVSAEWVLGAEVETASAPAATTSPNEGEKKSMKREFGKSEKLDGVCYDVRGPVLDEANRMRDNGVDIINRSRSSSTRPMRSSST